MPERAATSAVVRCEAQGEGDMHEIEILQLVVLRSGGDTITIEIALEIFQSTQIKFKALSCSFCHCPLSANIIIIIGAQISIV
jgi:hypothetical protein